MKTIGRFDKNDALTEPSVVIDIIVVLIVCVCYDDSYQKRITFVSMPLTIPSGQAHIQPEAF